MLNSQTDASESKPKKEKVEVPKEPLNKSEYLSSGDPYQALQLIDYQKLNSNKEAQVLFIQLAFQMRNIIQTPSGSFNKIGEKDVLIIESEWGGSINDFDYNNDAQITYAELLEGMVLRINKMLEK